MNGSGTEDSLPAVVQEEEESQLIEWTVSGLGITVISSLGIFGNAVTLIVLSQRQMRSSINCGLQALAAFDSGVLICACLMLGLTGLGRGSQEGTVLYSYSRHVYPVVVPVLYPLALMSQTGSVWTTVAVTAERFVAVCHPLRARSWCTLRRARYVAISVTVFAVVYNAPRCLEVERVDVFDAKANSTVSEVVQSRFRSNETYFRVYYIWLYLLVMYCLPFTALATLNVFIWRAVKLAEVDRQRLSRKQKREIGLALMLFCVVIVFLACNLLAFLANVLEYCQVSVAALVHTSNLLVTLNSSVNFVIYCIFGHKFRRMFLRLFCTGSFYRRGRRWTPEEGARHDSTYVGWMRAVSIRSSLSVHTERIEHSLSNGGDS